VLVLCIKAFRAELLPFFALAVMVLCVGSIPAAVFHNKSKPRARFGLFKGFILDLWFIWCGSFENSLYAVIVTVILGIKPVSYCVPVIGSRVAMP